MSDEKRLVLLNPLHPRMLAIVRYLEAQGGEKQIDLESLAKETGMPRQAVLRFTRWLELYGAVHVTRTSLAFGEGRAVNTYHLLMPVAEYEDKALDIREAVRRTLKPKPPKRSGGARFPKTIPVVDPKEMAAIQREARSDIERAIAGDPLPPLEGAPLDYDEVLAWSAFED